ncbi:MAG: lactonase family protein [Planctomycetes bacterium]|nr:lactonase family protein [Planctomycetota bacterium]
MRDVMVFVGCTADAGAGGGIYSYRLDGGTGALEQVAVFSDIAYPSFQTLSPDGGSLYSVCRLDVAEDEPNGGVAAFSIDRSSGSLTVLNSVSSRGDGAVHVSVDGTGHCLAVANYRSGNLAIVPIDSRGILSEASDFVQFAGSSIDPDRQQGSFAHSAIISDDSSHLFVQDLGTDKIMQFHLDPAKGKIKPNDPPSVATGPGAGPRHFEIHQNHKWAYVINELDNTLIVYDYDQGKGTLAQRQVISTLPDDFEGSSYCADIHIHPSGRVLYGSNRGHDSIAVFDINEADGTLSLAQLHPCGGDHPRNFALTPDASLLLCANMNSGNIVAHRIDPETGRVTPTGQETAAPKPVCVTCLVVG